MVSVNPFIETKESALRASIQHLAEKAAKRGHYDVGRVSLSNLIL
jgi:hypothetical protein